MRHVLCAIASVSGAMLRCRALVRVPQFQVEDPAVFVGFAQVVLMAGEARSVVVIVVAAYEVGLGLGGDLATCASPGRQAARGA